MPSKRSSNDLILFSSREPQPLVNWLCETYGLSAILQSVAEYQQSSSTSQPTAKRAYKKRGAKTGGAKKSAGKKHAGQKSGKKGGRKQAAADAEKS